MTPLLPLSQLIPICLAAFGVAWIMADSKISLPARHWVVSKLGSESLLIQFLECPPCLSFWLGLAWGIFVFHSFLTALFLAPVCTAFSIIAWSFVNRA